LATFTFGTGSVEEIFSHRRKLFTIFIFSLTLTKKLSNTYQGNLLNDVGRTV
jgi:hypothetical protein